MMVRLGGRISPEFISDIKVFHLLSNYHCNFVHNKDIYGNDTESSIHTGIQRSIISEIRCNYELLKQLNTLYVVVGGDMNFLLSELKNTIFASERENLVAFGLNNYRLQ